MEATDNLFGTWDQVPALSKYSLGANVESHIRVYEKTEKGFKVTCEQVRNGKKISWNYTAIDYDGKDYPVYGRTDVDAIASYKLDDLHTLGIFKKNGVAVACYNRDITSDGKTLNVIESGADDGTGKPYWDVTVMKKR